MANSSRAWRVLGHGPIERLSENLWWVQGDLPSIPLKRVMTVARLSDGRLVIHNGIALAEADMRVLEAWGTPAFLLVPNAFHRLDAAAYKARYPALRVLAPSGSRRKISDVVPVDGSYENFPAREDVRLRALAGVANAEGVMLVRSADGVSVVLNDVVFNMDLKRGVINRVILTLMGSAPGPRISRMIKFALVKDRAALKRELTALSQLPELQRLIVSHEKIASGSDARKALELATGYL
jgi:hypothetical protein